MSQGSAILIGTIIYAVIGVLGCGGFYVYVGKKTRNPHEVNENRSYTQHHERLGLHWYR